MKPKHQKLSGAEVVRQFLADPAYQERVKARRLIDEREEIARREDEKPILADLLEVGIRVDSVWDLVNTSASYPSAIPVLAKHLAHPYFKMNREGLLRALAVKESKGIADEALIGMLTSLQPVSTPEKHQLVWLVGNALPFAASSRSLPLIASLAKDPQYAEARDGMIEALGKWRNPISVETLVHLLDEPTACPFVLKALSKLRPKSVLERVLKIAGNTSGEIHVLAQKVAGQIRDRGWQDSECS